MMKVLITGGAGFIGSHISHFLVSKGFNVLIYDSFTRSLREPRYFKVIGVNTWKGNVRNYSGFLRMLKGFEADVVIHLAAFIDVVEAFRKPLVYFRNNALGTAVVAEACRRVGVERVVMLVLLLFMVSLGICLLMRSILLSLFLLMV